MKRALLLGHNFMATLSLAYFVNRAKVLAQYRSFCRVARTLAVAERAPLLADVRAQFELHRHEADEANVRQLLSQGEAQLKQLATMVGTASTASVGRTASVERAGSSAPVQVTGEEEARARSSDVLGRVGEEWPWSQ